MAFTVEDGTNVENANSYVTVAEFKAYCDDRAFSYATYSDTNIQTALIKATDYIENRYGLMFKGVPEFSDQPLSFPRIKLYSKFGVLLTGIPTKLKHATIEYAQRALTTALAPDPVTDDTGQRVVMKREKIGPIEDETQYVEAGGVSIYKPYPMADALLKELIYATGGRVVRA